MGLRSFLLVAAYQKIWNGLRVHLRDYGFEGSGNVSSAILAVVAIFRGGQYLVDIRKNIDRIDDNDDDTLFNLE